MSSVHPYPCVPRRVISTLFARCSSHLNFVLWAMYIAQKTLYNTHMSEGFTTTINEEIAGKMTPGEATRLLRSLAIPHAKMAIEVLVGVAENPRLNPAARVMAANSILDRGFGKPEQPATLVLPPGTGKTGVMLLPSGEGRNEWLSKASSHHQKMLAST